VIRRVHDDETIDDIKRYADGQPNREGLRRRCIFQTEIFLETPMSRQLSLDDLEDAL
jgi:hypothetical protein